MTEKKAKELIKTYFKSKDRRTILFWYDENKEYESIIDNLDLENVKVHKLFENNNFSSKKLLEYDDKDSNYIIYAPFKKPDNKENWFTDTLKYSPEFTLNEAEIIANELKIDSPECKKLVKTYLDFLKGKGNLKKFKSLENYDNKEHFELSVIAVLANTDPARLDNIIPQIYKYGLNDDNEVIAKLEKYNILERLWHYIENYYGYTFKKQNLKALMISFLISSLSDKLSGNIPDIWKGYVNKKRSNSVCLLNFWMNSKLFKTYDNLAKELEEELKIKDRLNDIEDNPERYFSCDTFEFFDKAIIEFINDKLVYTANNYLKLKEIISQRKSSHWFKNFENIYKALESAIDFFVLMQKYQKGFPDEAPSVLITNYADEYYKIDQAYRKFYTYYDQREFKEYDLLKELQEKIENIYDNRYLKELSQAWSCSIEENLIKKWVIPSIKQQKDFYQDNILPITDKDDRSKIFVIISDALRYEVAEEIASSINKDNKIKGDASLEFMQGVIPSYTALGMAALLPHKQIEIDIDHNILVDQQRVDNILKREKILKNHFKNSKAINYNDLKDLKGKELQTEFKTSRVIYIYHNQIDCIGDSTATEKQVFDAANKTFEDIKDCIKRLVNNLSATNILITSDHGFLYKRNALLESSKFKINAGDSIYENRRFVIIKGQAKEPGSICLSLAYMTSEESNLSVITPKLHNVFKMPGSGMNYVHGGASLQETVIPLLRFKAQKDYKKSNVDVKLTNTTRTITNNKFILRFFQVERVSETVLPRTLKAYIWDVDESRQISDEKTIIANIESEKAEERELKVTLTLKNKDYDKYKDYYLKLEDETGIYDQIPFRINIAFRNDFDSFI